MNKQIIVALCCLSVAGCGLFGPGAGPHSDYFVVAYRAATLEPTDDGKVALANALREAGGASRVMIEGSVNDSPANADNGALVQQRAAELEQELARAGIAAGQVRLRLREVGDAEFANRKDSLIVQVEFGEQAKE